MSDVSYLHVHHDDTTIAAGDFNINSVTIRIEKPGHHLVVFFEDDETLAALQEAVTIARERLHVANVSREFGEDRVTA